MDDWYFAPDHVPDSNAAPDLCIGVGAFAWSSMTEPNSGAIETATYGSRRAFKLEVGSANYMEKNLGVDLTTIGIGMRIAYAAGVGAHRSDEVVRLVNSGGSLILDIVHGGPSNPGALLVRRAGTTTVATIPAFMISTYRYLSLTIVLHASTGSVVARVDGTQVLSATGLNTEGASGGCRIIRVSGVGSTGGGQGSTYITDGVVRDGATAIPPVVHHARLPASDVGVQWTPDSGANNFSRVADSSGSDSDTSYVEVSAASQVDEYELNNVSGVGTILAVSRVSVATAPTGGTPLIEQGLELSATQEYGSALAVGGAGTYRTTGTSFFTKPGGGAWSETDYNNTNSLLRSA